MTTTRRARGKGKEIEMDDTSKRVIGLTAAEWEEVRSRLRGVRAAFAEFPAVGKGVGWALSMLEQRAVTEVEFLEDRMTADRALLAGSDPELRSAALVESLRRHGLSDEEIRARLRRVAEKGRGE